MTRAGLPKIASLLVLRVFLHRLLPLFLLTRPTSSSTLLSLSEVFLISVKKHTSIMSEPESKNAMKKRLKAEAAAKKKAEKEGETRPSLLSLFARRYEFTNSLPKTN